MENIIGGEIMKKDIVDKVVKKATKKPNVDVKGNGKTLKKVVKKCV